MSDKSAPPGEDAQPRVNKRDYLAAVTKRTGIPLKTVAEAYDGMVEELLDIASRGHRLTLTGFGRFYPQAHKGHRVQFADGGDGSRSGQPQAPGTVIDDYAVLKFSATRAVNRRLGNEVLVDHEHSVDTDTGELPIQKGRRAL